MKVRWVIRGGGYTARTDERARARLARSYWGEPEHGYGQGRRYSHSEPGGAAVFNTRAEAEAAAQEIVECWEILQGIRVYVRVKARRVP